MIAQYAMPATRVFICGQPALLPVFDSNGDTDGHAGGYGLPAPPAHSWGM